MTVCFAERQKMKDSPRPVPSPPPGCFLLLEHSARRAVAHRLHLWCGRNTTAETDWSRANPEQEITLLTNRIRSGWPSSAPVPHSERGGSDHMQHRRTHRSTGSLCVLCSERLTWRSQSDNAVLRKDKRWLRPATGTVKDKSPPPPWFCTLHSPIEP